MNDISAGLRTLIEKHVPTLVEEGSVAVNSLRLENPNVQAVKDAAHKVKGSSGSMGFAELSAIALAVEQHFARIINGTEAISDTSHQLIMELEKNLNELSPDKSSLY